MNHLSDRQTSIELLRIAAMLMVMVLHADFASFGVPAPRADGAAEWLTLIGRVSAETFSAVSVNATVLISGWFGIHASFKGFGKFGFQVLFVFTTAYLYMLLTDRAEWNRQGVANCLALGQSAWFVKAYAGLYIISPLLNLFCKKAGEKQLRLFLILFFSYQTLWGWLGPNSTVSNGYSAFSFIGLYILARYLHKYKQGEKGRKGLLIYLTASALNTILFFVPGCSDKVVVYSNPLVVAGATGLFLWFAGMKLPQNRAINTIASGAFAAYLLHSSAAVMPLYIGYVRKAWLVAPGVGGLLLIVVVITTFYVVAMLVDVVRSRLWRFITAKLTPKFKLIYES